MAFQPQVHQELNIESTQYRIAEHPAAPGMPHGQEGRAGIVYRFTPLPPSPSPLSAAERGEGAQGLRGEVALKVFKPRFRLPYVVAQAERIAAYAGLPGLAACRRVVLVPQRHAALLRQHPDLTYAVLMPWIEGPTWQEVLLAKQPLTPAQALVLARGLAQALTAMEERGLAHGDLSAPNVLLPALASLPPSPSPLSAAERGEGAQGVRGEVQLVDLEGLYAPGLIQPQVLSSGSAGYAHRQAAGGLWGPEADRFAGAVLLAEMLGWSDPQVVGAAWGESYFAPDEMQRESDRYRRLVGSLRAYWGEAVARLWERAWRSNVLADCPTFGEWVLHLPTTPRASLSAAPAADAVSDLLARAQRLEKEGAWDEALRVYRQARGAAANRALAAELDQIIVQLEQQQRAASRWEVQAQQAQAHMRAGRWAKAVALYEALLREPASPQQRRAWQAALAECQEEVELADLFGAAQRAMEEGRWAAAAELLDAIARRRPDYVGAGKQVRTLQAAVAGELARRERQPAGRSFWRVVLIGLVVVLVVGGVVSGGWYWYTRWQEEARQQAIAAATAQAVATERAATTIQMQQTAEAMAQERATVTAQARVTAIAGERATATAQAVILPVLAGTPVPRAAAAILPENADRVVQLARWGRGWATQIVYSPDGRLLAVGSSLGISLYDPETLREVRFIGTDAPVRSVAFAPGGGTVASGSNDGTVRLWRVEDGALLRTLAGHTAPVRSVAFAPGGGTVASGSDDGTVRLWGVWP